MGVRLKIEFDDVDDMMYVLTGKPRPGTGFPQLAGLFAALDAAARDRAGDATPDQDAKVNDCDPEQGAGNEVVTNYASLRPGDRVRWEGRTIQADGEVLSVDGDYDSTVVRIKRDDNGKTFKITFDDSPTYGKMYKL